jgi:CDP-paratose 2-epimerase
MNALITGGAGFVGSALAIALKSRQTNAAVVALDNLKRRGSELNIRRLRDHGVHFVHGDIRNEQDLAGLRGDFDVVIDASAEPSVHAGSAGSPDYVVTTNLMGTFNCLNFAHRHAARFLLLSTSRVYSIGPLREIAMRESPTRFEIADDQTIPGVSPNGISEYFPTDTARSFYGASKLAAEYLTQEFVQAYGLEAMVYRCGVIAGPGQFGKADQGVFTLWLTNHYFRRPLQYTGFGGSGKQVRDLIHIRDLCDFIVGRLGSGLLYNGKALNIGGGNAASISLNELTAICQEVTGNTVPVGCIASTAPVDVPVYISDCRRAEAETGWKPSASVKDIVADTFQWLRENELDLKDVL